MGVPAQFLVRARGLTRRFGSRTAVEALSFDVARGEVVALLGPNGAGKTTTMRMLAGLLAPDEGSVEFEGVPGGTGVTSAMRRRIGLLTESPGLWDRLSVEANLLTYARLHELPNPRRRVADALAQFGLLDRAADPAATLSKGMKQKLAIARTLLHDPALVLLDEPTAGLDPAMARSVRELVRDIRTEGRAVLIATHNLDEAERVADRIAVMQGRLVALDTAAALRRALFGARVRVVLAGASVAGAASFAEAARQGGARHVALAGGTLVCTVDNADADTPAIVAALVGAGARVRSVSDDRVPLEEVYLKLVGEDPLGGQGNPPSEEGRRNDGVRDDR
jgi:ABC-2 type transport system ATP-binding protein